MRGDVPGMRPNPWPNRILYLLNGVIQWLPGGNRSEAPKRILVYRMGNLGDIVVALPVFHALRACYPDAHFMLITSPTKRGAPGAAEVLAKDHTFDEMIVYYIDESSDPSFLRKLRNQIAAARIDLAILLPDDQTSLKSAFKQLLLMAASGVRNVVGAEVVDHQHLGQAQVPRLMNLIRPRCSADVEAPPWIHFDDEDKARVETMLPGQNGGPLIAVQCGAKRPANRWMPDRFIALGQRLVRDVNARLVFTGSEGEKPLIDAIIAGIGAVCTNLAGQTTIPELACLVAQCDACVSNDTGTMHVAACVGTPVVAIFSARDIEQRWYPYGDQHRILRHSPECSPCFQDTCPLYDEPICLTAHEVEHVLDALRRVLPGISG